MSDENAPPVIPQAHPADGPVAEARLSKCAVWSLILGILSILGLFLLTSVPAIILGIVGLVQIGSAAGKLRGRGFAICGLILSAVSLILFPIFMMIISITVPAYTGIRETALEAKNTSNMKQVVLACYTYAEDNNGKFPSDLDELVPNYLDIPEVLQYQDPSDSESFLPFQYFPGSDRTNPDTVLLAAPIPHDDQRTVAYVSGVVATIPEAEFQSLVQ